MKIDRHSKYPRTYVRKWRLIRPESDSRLNIEIQDGINEIHRLTKRLDQFAPTCRLQTVDGEVRIESNSVAATLFYTLPGVFAIEQPIMLEGCTSPLWALVAEKNTFVPPDIRFIQKLYSLLSEVPDQLLKTGHDSLDVCWLDLAIETQFYYSCSQGLFGRRNLNFTEAMHNLASLFMEKQTEEIISLCQGLLKELTALLLPFVKNGNLLDRRLIDPGQIVDFEELPYYSH